MGSIENLGTDIASMILSALLLPDDNEAVPPQKPKVSLAEQKQYMMKNMRSLTIEDKLVLGNIVVMNNHKNSLNWCSEGTVLNLDKLPNHVVDQMYEFISYKLNNRK